MSEKAIECLMAHSDDLNLYESKTSYIVDAENAAEMARLLRQDQLVTRAMGGLLPENVDPSHLHDVLDIACGPGGWVCDVASTYPSMRVQGIDISELMTGFAEYEAQDKELSNAHFRVMNALEPLDIPDSSFDFVNVRLIGAFMNVQAWPRLIQECWRILRSGGYLRLTELEMPFSNSTSFERLNELAVQATHLANQTFSTTTHRIDLIFMLRRFLREAGLKNIQQNPFVIDFSEGTEDHLTVYQDLGVFYKLIQPFLVKMNVTTPEEIHVLYSQAMNDMEQDNFCGLWCYLSAWGQKP